MGGDGQDGHYEGDDMRQRLAERIRGRREALRLTQAQLAQRASLGTAQIVSSIERAERDVKAVELAALARALHCDLADLLDEEQDEEPQVAWRERPGEGAEEREAQFLQLCAHYHLAELWTHDERDCRLPGEDPPPHTPTVLWARGVADRVSNALDLGSLPAASLQETLEERCGVKIFCLSALRGSAACARGRFGAAVALNASEARWRRNYSLAHELFHLVTWDWLAPERDGAPVLWPEHVERLANAFASSLLLPEHSVVPSLSTRTHGRSIPWRGLVEMAREFDVSTEALLWRLVTLNVMSDRQVRTLLDDPTFRGLDRGTFVRSAPPEELPERFQRLLERAYLAGEVSAGRIAEMTGRELAEVHHALAQLDEDEAGGERLVHLA